ncbi:MAG: hypothetical protein WBA25_10635, partial [Jannaschia sp.]
ISFLADPEFITLDVLCYLNIASIPVLDLSPAIHAKRLEIIRLGRSQIADLRPVLRMNALTDDNQRGAPRAIHFADTPACRDPAIAAAAQIEDDEERLQALLAHLRTLPPWPEPLPALTGERPSDEDPKSTNVALPIKRLSLSQARTILEQDYPLVRDRCQAVFGQLNDALADHRLTIPNEPDALDRHRHLDDTLTFALGLAAGVYDALPQDFSDRPLEDAEVRHLQQAFNAAIEQLQRAAHYVDRADHTPTYSGLLKIGCATTLGGMFALLPGVTLTFAIPAVWTALFGRSAALGAITGLKGPP